MWKAHLGNEGPKPQTYILDDKRKFKVCDALATGKSRFNKDTIYARYNTEIGYDNQIPLWLFGFLY